MGRRDGVRRRDGVGSRDWEGIKIKKGWRLGVEMGASVQSSSDTCTYVKWSYSIPLLENCDIREKGFFSISCYFIVYNTAIDFNIPLIWSVCCSCV